MLTQFLLSTSSTPKAGFSSLKPTLNEEKRLLASALSGEQHAYAALVKRYRSAVWAIALNTTGNREDAEEATQDTFAKAFRHLPKFRGDSSFKTWLSRIARTTSLNQLRLRGLPSISLDAPESPAFLFPEKSKDALESLLRAERAVLVRQAMRRLSKEDSMALQLFYFHEQSLEEICATTGWTVNTVKSRLHRARRRLQALLTGNFA
jgi:RNA polymerase sigma-70 factor (ECF subfamily)